MTNSSELCPTCRQPKEPKASGRLTQWIVACNCGAPSLDSFEEQGPTVNICAICKKRIERGRPGSFTQWVFRVDICDCEKPEAVSVPLASLGEAVISQPDFVDVEEDPEPLPLPSEKFPVNRYKPLMEIGGGMAGSVYLCRDLVLNKKVAVKTLRQLTPEQLVAFQQEAKASSRLSHPAIVQVLDFGATESGDPFMVMEFIDGISLDKYLEENGALQPNEVANIIGLLSEGLQVAHENGVFHRDVKPSNILVKNLGDHKFEARLIDFGLAHVEDHKDVTIFQGTCLVGSPLYMSPELAANKSYDARCEVYSLGCVMFELLTGRPPFVGETALNTLYMHVNERAPRMSEVIDKYIPEKLESIVAKCLEKNPDSRFQSTAELAKSLIPDTTPETTGVFAREKAKKGSLNLAIAMTLFIICGLFAAIAVTALNPKKESEKLAVKRFRQSNTERKVAVESKENAEQMSHAMTGFATVGASDDSYFGADNSAVEIAEMARQGKQFQNIILHKANLTDKDIDNIVALHPTTITMDDCNRITDKGLKKIASLGRIDRLVIDESTQITPAGLAELRKLKLLEFVSMRKSGLTDEHMKVLSTFPMDLHKINVSGNPKITAVGLNYFKNRKRPMEIVAEGCAILLPGVTMNKLAAEHNIRLRMEDSDTFDFSVFSEAMDDTMWDDEDGSSITHGAFQTDK